MSLHSLAKVGIHPLATVIPKLMPVNMYGKFFIKRLGMRMAGILEVIAKCGAVGMGIEAVVGRR
ncbi:MAG: hypothetical protein CFE44_06745 [Burkholderiales bacterium PBB4]|nr:MAG: hypothetical protein CFE44_06745 [Burkholderiales bacterium PBB4]